MPDTKRKGRDNGKGKGIGKGSGKGGKGRGTATAVKVERALSKQTQVNVGGEEYEVLLKLLFDLKSSKAKSSDKKVKDDLNQQKKNSSSSNSFSQSLISDESANRYLKVKKLEKEARNEKKERKKLLNILISDDKQSQKTVMTNTLTSSSHGKKKNMILNETVFINPNSTTSINKNVRLMVKAENTKGNLKLLIVSRSDNLFSLFTLAKNKLKMKKIAISAYVKLGKSEKIKEDLIYLSNTLLIKDDTVVIVSNDQSKKNEEEEIIAVDDEIAAEEDQQQENENKSVSVDIQVDDNVVIGNNGGGGGGGGGDDDDDDDDDETVALRQEMKDMSLVQSHTDKGNQLKESEITLMQQSESIEEYADMLQVRRALPAYAKRSEVLAALVKAHVVIIAGETGSGKTTQIPQYILENGLSQGGLGAYRTNIIVTQPRRVSAISVAKRVAAERGQERLGGTIGYQVRFDSRYSNETKVLFCTTGILLRRMSSDPNLQTVSHVIVDEVHERDLDTDFLLILLRDLVTLRAETSAPLKVLLMSATAQIDQLVQYMNRSSSSSSSLSSSSSSSPSSLSASQPPQVVQISGRTFPVTMHYLEDAWKFMGKKGQMPLMKAPRTAQKQVKGGGGGDVCSGDDEVLNPLNGTPAPVSDEDVYMHSVFNAKRDLSPLVEESFNIDLVVDLIHYLTDNKSSLNLVQGAILVFLPGVYEIEKLMRALRNHDKIKQNCRLMALHGSLPIHEQRKVFLPVENAFKVVVSTNVAESSLTIDDIVHVIDSGYVKESRYNPQSGIKSLETVWCSLDSMKQRAGRAGRTKPGHCWKLFPDAWKKPSLPLFRQHNVAEMCRTPLEGLVLQVAQLKLDPTIFLSRALNPPQKRSVVSAMESLSELGALRLTPLNQEACQDINNVNMNNINNDKNNVDHRQHNQNMLNHKEVSLTALGQHLASLPLDARLGKLLVLGCCFGCRDACLTIGATLSYNSPFIRPRDKQAHEKSQVLKKQLEYLGSDHLATVEVFNQWQDIGEREGMGAQKTYCRVNVLSHDCLLKLSQLRRQFQGCLSELGFCPPMNSSSNEEAMDETNLYDQDIELVRLVISAALYPNVGRLARVNGLQKIVIATRSKEHVVVHPNSINHNSMCKFGETSKFFPNFICFHSCLRTSQAFLHDTTFISKYAILLFASGNIEISHSKNGSVIVDGWMELNMPIEGAVLCKLLRLEVDAALMAMIKSPDKAFKQSYNQSINTGGDHGDLIGQEREFDDEDDERGGGGAGGEADHIDKTQRDTQKGKKKDSTILALAAVRRLVKLDSYKPPQFF